MELLRCTVKEKACARNLKKIGSEGPLDTSQNVVQPLLPRYLGTWCSVHDIYVF